MGMEFLEAHKVAALIKCQSLASTSATSSYVAVKDYERVIAFGQVENMTAGKTLKVELMKAKDSDGSSATAEGSATFTAAAGALSGGAVVEKRAEELGSDYTHVAVRITTDETKYASGALILGQAKIKPVTQDIMSG